MPSYKNNLPIQTTINFDTIPTVGSPNAVTSDGIYNSLLLKQDALTNPVTGTGTAGQVAYWDGTNTQTGSNNLFWDEVNNRLGVGLNTGLTARAHIRGSGTTSSTTALLVQNSGATDILTVRDDNRVIAHGGIFVGGLTTVAGILPQGTTNQENILIRSSVYPSSTGINDITLTNGQGDISNTTGTRTLVNINRNFSPTSGSGNYNLLWITSTINQTGGANGITRGLYVNPTLTSAADWRSVEFSNNSGWGLYGAGTANNYLGGSLGMGTTTPSNSAIRSLLPFDATRINGIYSDGAVTSNVTTIVNYTSRLRVNNSITTTSYFHYLASEISFGAGASLTNQYGYYVSSALTSATNNFGFVSDIASGTGRWNLYMNGTADNYLAGSLGIGSVILTTSNLRINKSLSGSTTFFNINNDSQIASSVTSNAIYNRTFVNTQATSFTLGNLSHYYASQGTFGLGSVVTNQYAFNVDSSVIGATNNYAYYSDIPSGTGRWNLYMNGTANNYLAGSLGIGTTSLSNSGLAIQRNITGTTSVISVNNTSVVQSDVTSVARYFATNATTQAATFNLGLLIHYSAGQSVFGLNSTVTNQYGYFVSSGLTGATNNFAFRGELASAANNWNLYMNGTAANYLAGNTSIGTTTSSGRLTVQGSGTTSATNGLLVEDSAGTDTFTIRDDGGYAFKGGTVGLAQTGYTTFTNLTTDRTCDANATTVEELADILGTLIEDLKTKGIIAA